MDLERLSPDDTAGCAAALAIYASARAVDCPDAVDHTLTSYAGLLRYGWDGVPPRNFIAREGDRPAGMLAVSLPEYDNTHVAWFDVTVAPGERRRGLGSELLARGIEMAREEGRRSIGIDGWETAGSAAFAARHAFEPKATEVCRRQVIADLDRDQLDKLYDEALIAARGYELLRITDAVPEDLIDAVVTMTAAINDAPTDDLDVEDEVYTPDRVRAFERAMLSADGWDRRLYRVVARHNETGEFGGHTLLGVERSRPGTGWQLDTSVVRAHRGHRLGLLLKIEQLRWLREAEPQLVSFDTWNAESNAHMIAVNEQLGYRIVGRAIDYQRALPSS